MLTQAQKIILVQSMTDRKDILKGNFKDRAQLKNAKNEAWKEIHSLLTAAGYSGSMNDLRVTEFYNIRKSTMVSD